MVDLLTICQRARQGQKISAESFDLDLDKNNPYEQTDVVMNNQYDDMTDVENSHHDEEPG